MAFGAEVQDFSVFGEQPWIAIALSGDMEAAIEQWLQSTSCPVIGIAAGDAVGGSVGADACDVVLSSRQELPQLIEKIEANPTAAATFVRLLRVTESMPLMDALEVESLAYATLQAGGEYQIWLDQHRADAPAQPLEDGPPVLIEREADEVKLTLNRASNRNAMSVEMRDALNESLGFVIADSSIASVQMTGLGPHFSTGGDLTEFGLVPDAAAGHIIRSLTVPGRALARCADRVTVHVHGGCVGSGIEFPAFASRVVAHANSYFLLPEITMGLIPGAGGCISIARRIGRQRLAYWALSNKKLDAQTALEWGLVDEISS